MKALRLLSTSCYLLPLICASAFAQSPVLNPSKGSTIGQQFEAYPSPWQEADEESATPANTDQAFKSTTPSMTRAQRAADGHRGAGLVRFSKDLSKAYVDIKIELGSTPLENINMFHIHCGVPGILGPILIDFALATGSIESVQQDISDDGILSVVITDKDIVQNTKSGDGSFTGALSRGCVIPDPSLENIGKLPLKVSTIAGGGSR